MTVHDPGRYLVTGVPAAARKFLLEPGAPAVFVPGPLCALLDRLALDDLRKRERGAVPELDALLLAIHLAGLSYETNRSASAPGTLLDNTPEPVAQSTACGVSEAADRLAISTRAVRQAATEGRLTGQLVSGRWLFEPSNIEAFRAARPR